MIPKSNQLVRIPPARCTGKFSEDLLDNPDWVAELKVDGARYQMYVEPEGISLYSRRDFPRIDKAANVPHITKRCPDLMYCALDGEVVDVDGKNLQDTTRVMNMLPANAISFQASGRRWLSYLVFDLLYLRGQDMTVYKYRDRRIQLKRLLDGVDNPFIKLMPMNYKDKRNFLSEVMKSGGEGIILKHVDSKYGEGWVKRKKYVDVTVIVTDFQEGRQGKTGRLVGTLGAIIVSAFHNGELIEVGSASGFTDDERHEVWADKSKFMHRACDVRIQKLTGQGGLREPRFIRWRDDVNIRECTYDAIVEAVALNQAGELYEPELVTT